MAKKPANETSLPVIVALVFFVLTTIGLGVFTYVLYSDQEAKDAEVAKVQGEFKNLRGAEEDAKQIALVHRVFDGLAEGDDLKNLADIKEGSKAFQELKKLNDALAAKGAPGDFKGFFPAEVDGQKQLKAPTGNLLALATKAGVDRDAALKAAGTDKASYDSAQATMTTKGKAYDDTAKTLKKVSDDLPKQSAAAIAALNKRADDQKALYQGDVATARTDNDKLTQQIDDLKLKLRRAEEDNKRIKDDLNNLAAKSAGDKDPLQFDEPLGKITNRLANNVVEIDLGSNALVQAGLTFSVLPYDYPEKGRQSRMKVFRLPDEKGVYRSVEQFVPKATLEVIEVLGPNLSRARITSEYDDIRERALPGDLLYNAVWRKGQADHVVLIGIFDINGDGSDDIEQVIRDLTKMGIPVDAYFDMRTQKWIGKLTDRTRYLVDGYTPTVTANDPHLEAKAKINNAVKTAKDEAKGKGITSVGFRDFFGKMGYRARIDVSEERINQAATKYLSGVGMVEAPPPAPPE